ncbi:NADPH-dependent diflavin oxidoreductase 1 [Glugoides intestinalis]
MIPILIGSQTGHGVHLAKLLNETFSDTVIIPIDSFNILKLNEMPFIIFIISTHGDGQCPFNMSRFYNLILSQKKQLFSFKFAMLGLGDSSYPKYNYCSRIASERLKVLGAELIYQDYCNAQDQNGMYTGYNRFKAQLSALYTQEWNSKLLEEDVRTEEKSFCAKVIKNAEITPLTYKNKVFEVIFEIPEYKDFYPGDCLKITPENPEELMGVFDFERVEVDLLKDKIDLFAVVHQNKFNELAELAESKLHREKLLEIANDYDIYHDYVVVPRRNIIEVANDFNLNLPFNFLKNLNEIYARHYSCSRIDGNYSVLYNIVQYETYLKKERLGLCTQYLKSLKVGDDIAVGIAKSALFLEEKKLLCFATGTGVTLPRSILHYFGQSKELEIFYGFRYFDQDQLCKEEFKDVKIHYASSRNQHKYIMDVYKENPVENIKEWLVFVSGNTRLNKEIRKLLKEVHGEEIVFQSETW